jgi:hypothetical protein
MTRKGLPGRLEVPRGDFTKDYRSSIASNRGFEAWRLASFAGAGFSGFVPKMEGRVGKSCQCNEFRLESGGSYEDFDESYRRF